MGSETVQPPKPGWYHEHPGAVHQRYWDGEQWTKQVRDPDTMSSSPTRRVWDPWDPAQKRRRLGYFAMAMVFYVILPVVLIIGAIWWIGSADQPGSSVSQAGMVNACARSYGLTSETDYNASYAGSIGSEDEDLYLAVLIDRFGNRLGSCDIQVTPDTYRILSRQ